MNKLLILALTSLTLLTSNAWAVGDVSSVDFSTPDKPYAIQNGGNELYASMLISQPADRNCPAQKGENELYGIM